MLKLKKTLGSKKVWAAVTGLIVAVIGPDSGLSETTIMQITALVLGFMAAQAHVDHAEKS